MKAKRIYKYPSPCLSCTRVQSPKDCENKQCRSWQQWFLDQWELIHRYPREQMEKVKPEPVGVGVGGGCYAAPHQVAAYLQKDPCKTCVCAGNMCDAPCRVKRSWEEARKEVSQ